MAKAKNGLKSCSKKNTEVSKQIMEVEQGTIEENGKIEENSSESNSQEFHGFTNDILKTTKQINTPKTRSRSRTPQSVNGSPENPHKDTKRLSLKKLDEQVNGNEEKVVEKCPENGKNNEVSIGTEKTEAVEAETSNDKSADEPDMEPLVLGTDDDHPELQFDENSDKESGQNSPLPRCRTRRSLTRKIPTPRTPKSLDSDSENNSNSVAPTPEPSELVENKTENLNDTTDSKDIKPENINDTNDSKDMNDLSTQVEVGSDTTRLDFFADDSNATIKSDDSFLNDIREKSLKNTLRGLTPRKTIRPLSGDYLKKAIKNSQNKSKLNLSEYDMADRIGIKRKSRSSSPEERKRFKQEHGFVSYLSSPINILKNRFKSSEQDSTPKLTAYKDGNHDIHEERNLEIVPYESLDKRSWCSLM